MHKLLLSSAIATCSVLGLSAPDVAAQGAGTSIDVESVASTQLGRQHFFLVKFICGDVFETQDDQGEFTPELAPGTYLTAINVGNLRGSPVRLNVRLAEALPVDVGTGRTATLDQQPRLQGRGALEIDCATITGAFDGDGTDDGDFVKGFATIRVPRQARIEVVAVYTVAADEFDDDTDGDN